MKISLMMKSRMKFLQHHNFPVDFHMHGLIINLESGKPSSSAVKYVKISSFCTTFELAGIFISLLIIFLPIANSLNIGYSLCLPGASISGAVSLYRTACLYYNVFPIKSGNAKWNIQNFFKFFTDFLICSNIVAAIFLK
jgi:hypothetical protein